MPSFGIRLTPFNYGFRVFVFLIIICKNYNISLFIDSTTQSVNLRGNYKLLILFQNIIICPPCESFKEKIRGLLIS